MVSRLTHPTFLGDSGAVELKHSKDEKNQAHYIIN